MSIQLPDARQLSDEALEVLRLRALRGIELGYSEVQLADLLGVCHETISRWWTAYLPSHAPERNPVEYLNDDLKGAVNEAGLPESRGAWYAHLMTFMDHLLSVPKHVVSYFLNPWVQYAAPIEI